jgi:hypothetical protein
MSDPLSMSSPMISEDSPNVISLPASESGVTPLERLDGQTILPFGQAPALARVSVQAGNGEASQISVTYGPHGSGSYASAALTSALANRLRVKTDLLGSTLFRLTWKERATPSGRQIPALRASGHHKSDSDCTSWPTPKAQHSQGGRNPETVLADLKRNNRETAHRLDDAAALAGWNTPTSPSKTGTHQSGNNRYVSHVRNLVGWATPTSRDWKDGATSLENTPVNSLLGRQVLLTDSGETRTGSGAETESIAPLNPEHSRWLQGLPIAWRKCADMVTD